MAGCGGGEEGATGDGAGVVLPLAAPGTAMETALPTRLARAPAARRLQLARPPPSLPPSLRASLPLLGPSLPGSARRSLSLCTPRVRASPLSRRHAAVSPGSGSGREEARGARGRVRGGELDGGDLEGEGQGRRPASLVRRFASCPHPTPVFHTNTDSEKQLVVFGDRGAGCSGGGSVCHCVYP